MWLPGWSLALLLAGPAGGAEAQESAARVSATMREGRVTLSARNAPLREILTEFGRASGIEIRLQDAGDESTTIAFDRMAPEEGLRRLLRARNFVLVYSGNALAEVHTYTRGRGEAAALPRAARAAPPGRPARVSRARPAPEADEATRREAFRLRAQALGDPDPAARAAGLAELAAGDDEQLALRTAANVLETERAADVVRGALHVFAGVETAPLEPLLAFLNANRVRDGGVRVQALELAAERGRSDPRVRELLVTLARNDGDSEVRESAQSLLKDLTNP